MKDDAKFLREKLEAYQAPRCPDELVDRILARVDAEADEGQATSVAWWSPSSWFRLLAPAAALAFVLLVVFHSKLQAPLPVPQGEESTNVAIAPPQETSTSSPCALDLKEIYRRLGVDRAQLGYDDATLCAAAEDVRTALTLVGRAVQSTERVLDDETRGRVSNAVRMGLDARLVSPATKASSTAKGG